MKIVEIGPGPERNRLLRLSPGELVAAIIQSGKPILREEKGIDLRTVKTSDIISKTRAITLGEEIIYGVGRQTATYELAATKGHGGRVKREAIDGSHRIAGEILVSERDKVELPESWAMVWYGLTRGQTLWRMITADTTVKQIKVARLVDWTQELWRETPHSWQTRLTPAKAAWLAYSDSSGGQLLKDDPETAKDVKAWIKDIVSLSQIKLGTYFMWLRVAEQADPNLMKRVRSSGLFQKGESPISMNTVDVLVTDFPGKSNYGTQNLIISNALGRSLSAPELKAVCAELKMLQRTPTEQEIRDVMDRGKWRSHLRQINGTEAFVSPSTVRTSIEQLRKRLHFSGLPQESEGEVLTLLNYIQNRVGDELVESISDDARKFLERWVLNRAQFFKLASGQDSRNVEDFKTGINRRLDRRPQDALIIIKSISERILGDDMQTRDAAVAISRYLPLEKLSTGSLENYLRFLAGRFGELAIGYTNSSAASDKIDCSLEFLERLDCLAPRLPGSWSELLSAVSLAAKAADEACQSSVSDFVTKQRVKLNSLS